MKTARTRQVLSPLLAASILLVGSLPPAFGSTGLDELGPETRAALAVAACAYPPEETPEIDPRSGRFEPDTASEYLEIYSPGERYGVSYRDDAEGVSRIAVGIYQYSTSDQAITSLAGRGSPVDSPWAGPEAQVSLASGPQGERLWAQRGAWLFSVEAPEVEAAKRNLELLLANAELYRLFGGEAPPCQADPPITADQINRVLDYIASQLRFAEEKAYRNMWQSFGANGLADRRFTLKDAADLGHAMWQQARGLQRAHLEGKLVLDENQKKRTKAFGHWADYLRTRAEADVWSFGRRELPPYPLFGQIEGEVATPPQLVGQIVEEVYREEYLLAAYKTIAQGADLYFTRGMVWTLYLAYSEESVEPVIWSLVPFIPKVGPFLLMAGIGYVEATQWDELTWDQHMANAVGVYGAGLGAYLHFRPQPQTRANPARPINEGNVAPLITEGIQNGAKAYKIGNRRTVDGVEYGTMKAGSVGPRKGRGGGFGPEILDDFEVKILKTADGGEVYRRTDNGRLVIPLKEKGYHSLKHLKEEVYGFETGEMSLAELARRSEYEPRMKAMLKELEAEVPNMDRVNGSYKEFVNALLEDPKLRKWSMPDRFRYRDGTFGPWETVYMVEFPCNCTGRNHHLRISVNQQSGQLMNLYVKSYRNLRERAMSRLVMDWQALDSNFFRYSPLYPYMPDELRGGIWH